jgi:hypothetical protein
MTAELVEDPPSQHHHQAAYALLMAVLARLTQLGFTRYRVDTLRHPDGLMVRHHYSSHDWSLTTLRGQEALVVQRWASDRPLPSVDEVVRTALQQ